MKILIISDYREWAFGHVSRSIKKFNQNDSADISIIYLNENGIEIAKKIWKEYDIIFVFGWYLYQHFDFIPKNKVIVGIMSFCKWDYGLSKETKISPPTTQTIEYLKGFARICVISQRLLKVFSQYDLPDIYYTPNGIDCNMFFPKQDMPDNFKAGTVARYYRWKLKRIDNIFIPSTKKAQVDHKILSGGNDILSYDQMPDFYNDISCYICTSRSEGFSTSCLEAAACGRPIISTDVGGTEELIISEVTGIIADVSVESFSSKISLLKNDIEKCKMMGDNARKHVINNYSWEKVVPKWMSFLMGKK